MCYRGGWVKDVVRGGGEMEGRRDGEGGEKGRVEETERVGRRVG